MSPSRKPPSRRIGNSCSFTICGNIRFQRRTASTFSSASLRRAIAFRKSISRSVAALRKFSGAERTTANSERQRRTASWRFSASRRQASSCLSNQSSVWRVSIKAARSPSRARALKRARADRRSRKASVDRTRAACLMGLALTLLEIFLDSLGLAEQERDVIVGRPNELAENLNGLRELAGELLMFLIAPSVAEGGELAVEDGELMLQFVVEVFQPVGKAPQVGGIDDGFGYFFFFKQKTAYEME